MTLTLPTSITESNVLWGIAAPLAIIRAPQGFNKAQEEVITFDLAPGAPPEIRPVQETIDSGVTKSGRLFNEFKVRFEFRFRYDFLTAAEAIKWGKLWNYHMAKYELYLRPHNDNGLQLEWQVVPSPNSRFDLGYLKDKYIGHTLDLSFTSVEWQDNIPLQTSQIGFNPAIL